MLISLKINSQSFGLQDYYFFLGAPVLNLHSPTVLSIRSSLLLRVIYSVASFLSFESKKDSRSCVHPTTQFQEFSFLYFLPMFVLYVSVGPKITKLAFQSSVYLVIYQKVSLKMAWRWEAKAQIYCFLEVEGSVVQPLRRADYYLPFLKLGGQPHLSQLHLPHLLFVLFIVFLSTLRSCSPAILPFCPIV